MVTATATVTVSDRCQEYSAGPRLKMGVKPVTDEMLRAMA
jgi:hypothetical protein